MVVLLIKLCDLGHPGPLFLHVTNTHSLSHRVVAELGSSGAGFSEFKAHTVKFNFWCLLEGKPEEGATRGTLLSERVVGIWSVGEPGLRVQ